MPQMRNISKRLFVIAGRDLKQNEVGDFAQSTIDRHVAMYPNELKRFGGAVIDTAPAVPPAPPEDEVSVPAADDAPIAETALAKPKRGRKAKSKG